MSTKEYTKRLLETMEEVLQPHGFRKRGLVFTAER